MHGQKNNKEKIKRKKDEILFTQRIMSTKSKKVYSALQWPSVFLLLSLLSYHSGAVDANYASAIDLLLNSDFTCI